jgi:hypothetical protein
MAKRRARRVHFSVHAIAAIGGAAAALLFIAGWVLVSLMGPTADIYVQLLTSVEMSSLAALIQGVAVSFAIGSFVGAGTAWLCNRLGLLFEPE